MRCESGDPRRQECFRARAVKVCICCQGMVMTLLRVGFRTLLTLLGTNPSSGSISTSRVHCTLPLVVTSNVQIVYYVLPLHCQQFEHAPHHHTTSWMGRLRARVSNQSTSASGTRVSRKARSCVIVIVIRIIIRIPSRQCRCRLHWARRCHHCCMTGYLGRSLVLFNYC